MPQTKTAVHSLPSFAQAFSSLNNDNDNALPPIQSRPSPLPRSRTAHTPQLRHDRRSSQPAVVTRKRPRAASPEDDDGYASSERSRSSPQVSFIKEEQDYDQLEPTPPPPPPSARNRPSIVRHDSTSSQLSASSGAPPPSLLRPHPPSKRRRVTISELNTNLTPACTPVTQSQSHSQSQLQNSSTSLSKQPQTQPAQPHTGPSTPISPVVMGFTIERDNPHKFEQVRAMLSVKQKQKALIESRRGSTAGLPMGVGSSIALGDQFGRRGSAAGMIEGRRGSAAGLSALQSTTPTVNIVNPALKRADSGPSAIGRRGAVTVPPNTGSGLAGPAHAPASSARVVSPPLHVVPSQNPRPIPHRSPPSQALHPPSSHAQIAPPHPAQAPQHNQAQPKAQAQAQNQAQAHTQAQQAQLATQGLSALANALPPPPTSFARRRAGQLGMRGNKPADIVISPRETDPESTVNPGAASGSAAGGVGHRLTQGQPRGLRQFTYKSLQPAIQSAPPVPRFGEQPGRFPMALPSLPPAIGAIGQGNVSLRRTGAPVPPTPTRLSMQRNQSGVGANVRLSQTTASGNGNAQSLLPATPATLHRPGGTATDRAAFLAPFEAFYDALADAQVLKGWFGEQLSRVGKVVKEVEAQKAELEKARAEVERQRGEVEMTREVERRVQEAVEREANERREEIALLRKKVGELEEGLWPKADSAIGASASGAKGKGKAVVRAAGVNGLPAQQSYPLAPGVETYKFPPEPVQATLVHRESAPELSRRSRSPVQQSASAPGASASPPHTDSPAPSFDAGRRLSVSAIRDEPQHPQSHPVTPRMQKAERQAANGGSGRNNMHPPPISPRPAKRGSSPTLANNREAEASPGKGKNSDRPNTRRSVSQNSASSNVAASGNGNSGNGRRESVKYDRSTRRGSLSSQPGAAKRQQSPMDET